MLLFVMAAVASLADPRNANADPPAAGSLGESFGGNDRFIGSINRHGELDLADPKAVFGLVFSNLADEVVVYPSENYYYFTLDFQGRTVWGSIALFADDREKGVVHFGYSERVDKLRQPCFPVRGGSAAFAAEDGLTVRKLNDFAYAVSFEGNTRVFKLNELGLAPPTRAKLTSDEVFVAPTFDESGLKFFLIFNQAENHVYWVLDEDSYVAEHFRPYSDDVVIGDRTEFAFYVDRLNDRKILVGVEGLNVLQNNWYDGPFDQLPDNYVRTGQLNLRQFLERAFPSTKGQIDDYGNYREWPGARVAVTPYRVYFAKEEVLDTVASCRTSSLSASKFYSCITEQVFSVPDRVKNCSGSREDGVGLQPSQPLQSGAPSP